LQAADKRCGAWFDKLTMRFKPLNSLGLILSVSKEKPGTQAFSILLAVDPDKHAVGADRTSRE
jgi:hypothetical protein